MIDDFVRFCELLSKPENQIKVRTGQYIERQVNTRTEQDMANEIRRELVNLPKYTAYAKVLREKGSQEVWKGKIQTLKLKPLPEGEGGEAMIQLGRNIIQYNSLKYLKRRTEIEEEIRQRQEGWKGAPPDNPLLSREDEHERTRPSAPVVKESDEPPPYP